MTVFNISFIKNGIGQANLCKAETAEQAQAYFESIAPDVEIIGVSVNNECYKPGKPCHEVPEGWETPKAENVAAKNADRKQSAKVSASARLSLWERCKVDNIPDHDRKADTKTVAAETRKHIKERFPEIKFSCRIGSGGWAAANEVNFYFKSAPFSKDSAYFKAVKKYVEAWLWSFNYDNSDSMTDYFDRNFYEFIKADYDFAETEPTEAQKADLANFDEESQKAKEEEAKQQAEEYKKYLAECEAREKDCKKREEMEKAQKEEINSHVCVVEIAENDKYIISGNMICGAGKENSLNELQNDGTEKEESAVVKKELHFSDENIYNNFCNLFLHDFGFLNGCGGTGTLDKRVNVENYRQLNSAQRESVKWILWDCVAVFLNNELRLIIDPEGYSYSRYVNVVSGEYTKAMLHEEEHAEEQKDREAFHFPAPIAEQAQNLEVQMHYTLIDIDPWTMCATTHHITLNKANLTQYAQYNNALHIEYSEQGKKKDQEQYFRDGSSVLLYEGFLPPVPLELIKTQISDGMYQMRNAGAGAGKFMVDVFRHYKSVGYDPVVNTLQF